MARLYGLNCCGVTEIVDLFDYDTDYYNRTPKEQADAIIKEAADNYHGMVVAYFVKPKGEKKFQGEKLMGAFVKRGFRKQRKFINPNTGNTLQPMYYILKKKERNENPDLEYEGEIW